MLTLSTFVLFTALVALLSWLLTRKEDHATGTGYFLAGRKLTFPVIAGSLLLTNLSTEQMVGLNGAAYNDGLAVMVWEVVAVIALVAMALFFLPRFLKSGIATLPQYLSERYDGRTRTITDVIFLIAYAVILLPIILYTGAAGLSGILDVAGLLGFTGESVSFLGIEMATQTAVLWISVWFIGLIGSCYALFGGLRTVAISDTINGAGLLIGGLMIPAFGLIAIANRQGDGGGMMEGLRIIQESQPERLDSLGGPESSVPWPTIFTGIILLHLFYWCTNQQIIQRTFGARSLQEGQKGVLLTGALKLLGPLFLVLPGIIAYQLYAGDEGMKADLAYGQLVNDVLPAGLVGFFAAVLVGAVLSSFNSALNSTTTIFSYGVYGQFINREADDRQLVNSGKTVGWIIAIVAMCIAPWLAQTESIFGYLQKMNAMYFIPILAVVVVGMLSRRTPAIAANLALILGLVLIALGYFLPVGSATVDGQAAWLYLAPDYIHEYHFIGGVFAFLVLLMLGITAAAPLDEPWEQRYSGDVELTPWRGTKWAGGTLVVLVILIYLAFAGGTG